MVTCAFDADRAECRYTGLYGIRRIGAAAAELWSRDRKTAFFRRLFSDFQKLHGGFCAFHFIETEGVGDLRRHIRHEILFYDGVNHFFQLRQVIMAHIAEVTLHFAVRRCRIGDRAAGDGTDIDIIALGQVRQGFDLDDLV